MNIKQVMEHRLSGGGYQLLKEIGDEADRVGVDAYLVGGVVRDVLLHRPITDFDIVVAGDGVAFAEALVKVYGGTIKVHEAFKTASWFPDDANDVGIDVISARKEFYRSPGALPEVQLSRIEDDLFRRDFTVNAMAVQLNRAHFGKLLDCYCGQEDIRSGYIRVLHPMSFVDDPTRQFRAVRFEMRLGFVMDEFTEKLAKDSVRHIKSVSDTRVANELRLLLREGLHQDCLVQLTMRLQQLGIWQALWRYNLVNSQTLEGLERLAQHYHALLRRGIFESIDDAFPYLWTCYIAIMCLEDGGANGKASRYLLLHRERQVLGGIEQCLQRYDQFVSTMSLGELHEVIHGYDMDVLLYLWTITKDFTSDCLIEYIQKRQQLPDWINGAVLKELEVVPGPIYGEILLKWQCAYMDGDVRTEQESIDWVKSFIFYST